MKVTREEITSFLSRRVAGARQTRLLHTLSILASPHETLLFECLMLMALGDVCEREPSAIGGNRCGSAFCDVHQRQVDDWEDRVGQTLLRRVGAMAGGSDLVSFAEWLKDRQLDLHWSWTPDGEACLTAIHHNKVRNGTAANVQDAVDLLRASVEASW